MEKAVKAAVFAGVALTLQKVVRDRLEKEFAHRGVDPLVGSFVAAVVVALAYKALTD